MRPKIKRIVELFQFTPLREGRQAQPVSYLKEAIFQFTPLREGRPAPASEAALCA